MYTFSSYLEEAAMAGTPTWVSSGLVFQLLKVYLIIYLKVN